MHTDSLHTFIMHIDCVCSAIKETNLRLVVYSYFLQHRIQFLILHGDSTQGTTKLNTYVRNWVSRYFSNKILCQQIWKQNRIILIHRLQNQWIMFLHTGSMNRTTWEYVWSRTQSHWMTSYSKTLSSASSTSVLPKFRRSRTIYESSKNKKDETDLTHTPQAIKQWRFRKTKAVSWSNPETKGQSFPLFNQMINSHELWPTCVTLIEQTKVMQAWLGLLSCVPKQPVCNQRLEKRCWPINVIRIKITRLAQKSQ